MAVTKSVCVEDTKVVGSIKVMTFDGLKKSWNDAVELACVKGVEWRIPTINDVAKIEEGNLDAVSYEFWTASEYPSLDKQGMYVKKLGKDARPEWMGTPSGVVLVSNVIS